MITEAAALAAWMALVTTTADAVMFAHSYNCVVVAHIVRAILTIRECGLDVLRTTFAPLVGTRNSELTAQLHRCPISPGTA